MQRQLGVEIAFEKRHHRITMGRRITLYQEALDEAEALGGVDRRPSGTPVRSCKSLQLYGN